MGFWPASSDGFAGARAGAPAGAMSASGRAVASDAVPTTDLDAATAFYEAAFGWASTPFGDDFRMLTDHDGAMVGGLERARSRPTRHRRGYGSTSAPTILKQCSIRFVAPAATCATSEESIGGDYGWYATVVDPFGNPIGLTTATPTA